MLSEARKAENLTVGEESQAPPPGPLARTPSSLAPTAWAWLFLFAQATQCRVCPTERACRHPGALQRHTE